MFASRTRRTRIIAILLAILPDSRAVSAQTPGTQPSTPLTAASKPTQEHLTATVTAVKGLVRYRESADKPWAPCTVGLVLNEGAEFQTGPRSNVQLSIPPKQTVTLDRLGSMTLLEAIQSSGKFVTDVGLKRGRVRYNIEAPGIEHESTVSSPNGTLAVRDTSFAMQDESGFPPEAYRLSGTVQFSTAKQSVTMGGQTRGNVKAVGDAAPAETAVSETVVDPNTAAVRTPAEGSIVADVLSRGAVYSEVTPKRIPNVSGGVPPSDAALPGTLPGALDFVVRWNGNANLDLGLVSLASAEGLYPATGLNTSKSGGIIPFNDIGGPNGGIELAYWNAPFPKGIFEILVYDVSGVPVDYKIDVFENKTHVPLLGSDSVPAPTLTGSISAGQVVAARAENDGGSLVPPTGTKLTTLSRKDNSSPSAFESPGRTHR